MPSVAEAMLAGLFRSGVGALSGEPAPAGETDTRPRVRAFRLKPLADPTLEPCNEWAMFGLPTYGDGDPPGWAEQKVAELLPRHGALGDYLEHLPPGERLGKVLAAIDPAAVDSFSLVEVVAAYKRMESWAAAKAARAAAVLAERPEVNPTWPGTVRGRNRGECVIGQELAMRLRITRMAAIKMVAAGRAFGGMFEPTGRALEDGQIDYPRAMAIVTTLLDLPAEVALAAQWEVLDKAPGRTLRQVQNDLARAVIAVDPDSADDRHRAARAKRCVNRPRPLPDGMALMSAVLPATDAIALDTALEAAARAAKNTGDSRTLDQLRADCLALMGHTALALGHIGPHPALYCSCAGCASQRAEHEEAGTAAAPAGDSDPAPTPAPPSAGAVPSGAGDPDMPLPTSTPAPAPALAPDAATSTSDTTGMPTSTGAPMPATGSTEVPAPAGAAEPQCCCASRPRVADGPPHPGHRLPGGLLPLIKLGTLAGGRADIRITVPLNVLLPDERRAELSALERDPEPVAELEGYGPIPPLLARALSAGGVWRRLVTDPAGHQVLDVGRTRYQPPAALAEYVRERDRTCIRPGCSGSALTADLDHIHEYQHGGVTSASNLGPMCTSDHPVKSIGAYTVAYSSNRTYAWTTPTGHGYLRRPDGTTVTLPRVTAEGLRTVCKEAERSGRSVDPTVVDAVLAAVSAGTDVGGSWVPGPGSTDRPVWPGTGDGPGWGTDDAPPF